jgi:hypothetical protein
MLSLQHARIKIFVNAPADGELWPWLKILYQTCKKVLFTPECENSPLYGFLRQISRIEERRARID